MKKIFILTFCCLTSFFSFTQDSTGIFSKSVFKFQFSTGGAFMKNIEEEFSSARMPFTFVEGGIEIGRKFNVEINLRGSYGSSDSLTLNFTNLFVGMNNKSRLNDKFTMLLRFGGGVIFEDEDFGVNREITDNRIRYLRMGAGLEQRLFNQGALTFNLGYDLAVNRLFSGLSFSMGLKVGLPFNEEGGAPFY